VRPEGFEPPTYGILGREQTVLLILTKCYGVIFVHLFSNGYLKLSEIKCDRGVPLLATNSDESVLLLQEDVAQENSDDDADLPLPSNPTRPFRIQPKRPAGPIDLGRARCYNANAPECRIIQDSTLPNEFCDMVGRFWRKS
jgi:hypothetical protein